MYSMSAAQASRQSSDGASGRSVFTSGASPPATHGTHTSRTARARVSSGSMRTLFAGTRCGGNATVPDGGSSGLRSCRAGGVHAKSIVHEASDSVEKERCSSQARRHFQARSYPRFPGVNDGASNGNSTTVSACETYCIVRLVRWYDRPCAPMPPVQSGLADRRAPASGTSPC